MYYSEIIVCYFVEYPTLRNNRFLWAIMVYAGLPDGKFDGE